MNKKICKLVSTMAIVSLIYGGISISVQADEITQTAATVTVNGQNVNFDAYNINGNNYFKLRDLAYVLNATEKQFSIGYGNVLNTVSLTSGQQYTTVGGELEIGNSQNIESMPTDSVIVKDGEEVELQAYNINGNNYFKLRDIGELFDFSVNWNSETTTISINTAKGYTQKQEGDSMMNETTYYSKYEKGNTIQIEGVINSIEEYRGERNRWGTALLLANVTDESGNVWLVALNLDSHGIGHKKDFESYINKKVNINGIYEGYSAQVYKSPVVTLYEMSNSDNVVINGIRKAEDMLNKGKTPIENETDVNWTASSIKQYIDEIQSSLIGYED